MFEAEGEGALILSHGVDLWTIVTRLMIIIVACVLAQREEFNICCCGSFVNCCIAASPARGC